MSITAAWITAALPQLTALPATQQAAVSEALELAVRARQMEQEAMHLLVQAVRTPHTWWRVHWTNAPATPRQTRSYDASELPARVAGCGNVDAAQRVQRRLGARHILAVLALEARDDPS